MGGGGGGVGATGKSERKPCVHGTLNLQCKAKPQKNPKAPSVAMATAIIQSLEWRGSKHCVFQN